MKHGGAGGGPYNGSPLHPVTVISRAVTSPAFTHPNVLRERRHPDGGNAETLDVIELLTDAGNVAAPVFPELLFFRAALG